MTGKAKRNVQETNHRPPTHPSASSMWPHSSWAHMHTPHPIVPTSLTLLYANRPHNNQIPLILHLPIRQPLRRARTLRNRRAIKIGQLIERNLHSRQLLVGSQSSVTIPQKKGESKTYSSENIPTRRTMCRRRLRLRTVNLRRL